MSLLSEYIVLKGVGCVNGGRGAFSQFCQVVISAIADRVCSVPLMIGLLGVTAGRVLLCVTAGRGC